MRLILPVLMLLATSAANCYAAGCPIWFNIGSAYDQASSVPVLNLVGNVGGAPVTSSLALNGPLPCSNNQIINDPPAFCVATPRVGSNNADCSGNNWLTVTDTFSNSLQTLVYTFTADPHKLPAGQYLAYLELQGSGFDNDPFGFPIVFSVVEPGDAAHFRSSLYVTTGYSCSSSLSNFTPPSTICTSTPPATATAVAGSNANISYVQNVLYTGSGGEAAPHSATLVPSAFETPFWLQNVSIQASSDGVVNHFVIKATMNTSGLAAGVYQAYVAIYDEPATSGAVIPFTLTVVPPAVAINPSTASVNMTYVTGSSLSSYAYPLGLSSNGGSAQYIVTGPSWLNISPNYGSTNSTATLTVNPANLPPFGSQNSYTASGKLTVYNLSVPPASFGSNSTTVASSTQIPVNLTVYYGTPLAPGLYSTQSTLNFYNTQQNPANNVTTLQTAIQSKASPAPVPFTVTFTPTPANAAPWLQVTPSQGSTQQTITATVVNGATKGLGFITVTATQPGIPPVVIPVTLNAFDLAHIFSSFGIGSDPGIDVSANTLAFSTDPALNGPQYMQLTPFNNYPAGANLYCTPIFSSNSPATWLNMSPQVCPLVTPFSVSVDPTALSPDIYTAVVSITDDAGNNLNAFGVAFTVLAPGASPSSAPPGGASTKAIGRGSVRVSNNKDPHRVDAPAILRQ